MVCLKFKGLAQQVWSEVLYESYYSQELLPCSTVLALSLAKIELAKATIHSYPLCSWDNTAPIPLLLASVSSKNSLEQPEILD